MLDLQLRRAENKCKKMLDANIYPESSILSVLASSLMTKLFLCRDKIVPITYLVLYDDYQNKAIALKLLFCMFLRILMSEIHNLS